MRRELKRRRKQPWLTDILKGCTLLYPTIVLQKKKNQQNVNDGNFYYKLTWLPFHSSSLYKLSGQFEQLATAKKIASHYFTGHKILLINA